MNSMNKRLRELEEDICQITKQRDDLLSAIETTLSENGHLADGENCTLITLKRAVASVKEKQ